MEIYYANKIKDAVTIFASAVAPTASTDYV